MSPVYQRSFFTLKKRVASLANDLVQEGTATGGSATTLDDTANFTDGTDTRLKGVNVYIGNGAGQSRETRSTAFTPANDRITIPSGTALDATSEYMLTQRFTQRNIVDAIRDTLASYGSHAKAYEDQSLIAGSPLVNATFYDNSGTFPNGWTPGGTGGTFTQQSGTGATKHGRFAGRITSDGTNACSIAQNIPNPGRYRGKSVQAHAWIRTPTGIADSLAYLQLSDGVTTQKNAITGTSTRGWGSEEFTTTAFTVSDRVATGLAVTIGIEAVSGSKTIDVSGVYITPRMPNEWPLPAGSPTGIEHIYYEDYEGGPFQTEVSMSAIECVRESTRRLRINSTLPQGRILHIVGRTSWADHATAASDDDTSFDGLWPWLTYEAAYRLLLTKPRKEDLPQMDRLKALADSMRPAKARLPAGALDLVWP